VTYFAFLGRFVLVPLAVLLGIVAVDAARGRRPSRLTNASGWGAVVLHVIIAVLYTTPWDNYLVATGVWWYDPQLVTGILLGWVPIEEYTFFIVQTLLTGAWLLFLARRLSVTDSGEPLRGDLRWYTVLPMGVVWLSAVLALFVNWVPGTYLGLQLVWALPPIGLQLAFGADILWRYRRLVGLAVLVPTVYLSAADVLAITAGIWTIDPQQTVGVLIAGALPLEELLFFLLTNTLVVFGVTLVLASESRSRIQQIQLRWIPRMARPRPTRRRLRS
jgi:lycopene cyclase domain-containing protein